MYDMKITSSQKQLIIESLIGEANAIRKFFYNDSVWDVVEYWGNKKAEKRYNEIVQLIDLLKVSDYQTSIEGI